MIRLLTDLPHHLVTLKVWHQCKILYCLKFQIDNYEVHDTDTANQVNHFQTCSCKGVEIMLILNFIGKLT